MSFPRYPAYKDSGVEWLGDVPGHWRAVPIKHLGRLKGGAGFPHEKQGVEGEELSFHKVNALAQADSDGFLRESENTIDRSTAKELGAFIFPAGSIVFAKVGAALLLGRIRLLSQSACLDNNMMGLVIRQDEYVVKFVRHAMNLIRFDLIANPGAVPSLNEGQVGDFRLAMPPLPEQTQIATFLDGETAKIDALVAEQRRLIELLKEKRQAVISHAVTRGLNPDAPMKPSGIEWLGDVPEHWEVKRLRDVANLNPSKSEIATMERDSLVSFLPMSAIGEDGSLSLDSEKPIGELESGYTYFRNGDVTIAKITPCYENGKGALMHSLTQGVGFGTTELIVVRPKPEESCGEFLHFLFVSTVFRNIGESHMYGAGGQKRVPDDFVRNFATGFPPVPEQAAIAAFLDVELAKFDTLTTEAQHAIDLLQERRTALISAAVTGQIDVRSAV